MIRLPPIFDERGDFVRFGCILVADDRAELPICGAFPGGSLDATGDKVWNLLFPRGEWHGPNLQSIGGSINLTDAVFAEMISNWQAAGKPRLPIRKTHLHLVKDDPELQASYGALEDFRIGKDGLETLTDWNDAGRAAVKSGAWAGWSPEWYPKHTDRRTGETKGWWLSGTALTNDPFFISMPPVAASEAPAAESTDPTPNKEHAMSLVRIAAALGLSATATEDAIIAAAEGLKKQPDALTASTVKDAIIAAAKPLEEKVVALTAALDAEKSKGLERDLDAAIATAKRGDGKLGRVLPDTLVAMAKRIGKSEGLTAAVELLNAIPLTVPVQAIGFDSADAGETLSASAANDKLTLVANELAAKGTKAPMEAAMALHPELAKAARSLTFPKQN